ncbi:CheR family methyltransferase [Pseudomonas typographi]|uniref:Chemotaxis protein methyltransferase n=1 Tax=Pseudomonas typographi TaxID=2715964 RepID=A0ABR7YYL1_9PSED|nr:protein-glutamate O-methyltransferase CheR [Pseudomonas typographi]MBD1587701.1 protein-glutamate O-methyltransferase CheR [Pseudomonas typographi]MBD1598224.1 protein-glutamate O-methyltransferase CheR [Pseudomonas typographi]
MSNTGISDAEFAHFQGWLYQRAGIHMSANKKALVAGRLACRLRHHGLADHSQYFQMITAADGLAEAQVALDLLTTNETYFFREPKHFEWLGQVLGTLHRPGRTFRVWSAACSSGEEPYSLAMLLADRLGERPWEVLGSDISSRVLEKAARGHYPLERGRNLAPQHLARYCLKGIGSQDGTFLVERSLRERVQFMQVNLNDRLPRLGEFDVIFLRNVLIYFDPPTKRRVIERLVPLLRPGGYFVVSHSESLNGMNDTLALVSPSIYRKP